MNERNLSRKLSTSVVDALKSHGHILVVKGGATALARELEELMSSHLERVAPRIEPRVVGGEVTSTFGDESIDEAVEEMVAHMTRALMDSDHVEDVFAEDNVIRRDIFRAVRDGLLQPTIGAGEEEEEEEETAVKVRLDTLGYVAGTVSKLADPNTLRGALERAAAVAQARFAAFDAEAREATFRLEGDGPDERLELEEAVADELTELVEQGSVELPSVERDLDLGRALSAADQRAVRRQLDTAADAMLRSGCAVSWEFHGPRALKATFTPLSDRDARNVEDHVVAFARQIAEILSDAKAAPRSARSPGPAPTSSRGRATKVEESEPPPPAEEVEAEPAEEVAPSKRTRAAKALPNMGAASGPHTPGPAKRATKRAASEAPRSSKSAATKRTAAKRAAVEEAPPRSAKGTASSRKSAATKAAPAKRAAAGTKARKAPAKKR